MKQTNRTNTYLVEVSVPAGTTAAAPLTRLFQNVGGEILTGVYCYANSPVAFTKVYFRVKDNNGIVFPGDSFVSGSGVPNGWSPVPDRTYHDVNIPISGPQYYLTCEFINIDASIAYTVYLQLTVSQDIPESALFEIIRLLRDEVKK